LGESRSLKAAARRWRWKGTRASARFDARMTMAFGFLAGGSGARKVKRRERRAPCLGVIIYRERGRAAISTVGAKPL